MERSAKVTGLSPLEGPPGTKVTIRGENLGLSQNDLIGLSICGEDCLMYAEWFSSSKIITRSRSTAGKGDVLVTTASAGKGTCTVQFRGFYEPIGPTIESAVWVDESNFSVVSFGHTRATSPSQLHPDDPLGLSDEGNISKVPQEDLRELFPSGSGNLLVENFSPTWYLLENHHGTTFLDLKAGLNSLRRKVNQHKEGPLSFLKSNVMAIMECLEILSTLQLWLVKDKQELGNGLIDKLEDIILNSQEEANDIFEDVLARKDKTDSMRNALSVLQRFRFLFNLPANLEKNIQQGDYDIVINDYARAKFLFQNTEVAVFKKVYQEVEQRIEKFRSMLFDRLMNLPLSVDEQKKLVRHLVNLESSGNPAWEAVINMYRWLLSKLIACKDNHLGQATSVPSVSVGSKVETNGGSGSSSVADSPQVVQFVEDACEIFELNFPEFRKLGQAYFSGDLHVREGVDKPERTGLSKQESYQSMALELTTRLCNLIRAALLPQSLQSGSSHSLGHWPKTATQMLGPWLPYCVRFVRQCFSTLMKLDLPQEVLNVVQQLLLDLRVHSMSCLFAQATEDIRNLHTRETWLLEMDDYSGATTQLPLLFESRVVETMQLIRENVLQCGPKETQVLSQINVQANMKQLSQALIYAFAQALDQLAKGTQQDKSNTTVVTSHITFEELESENILNNDQKLLVVLSNCNYTCKSVVPRLQESFVKHGYPDMGLVIQGSEARFRELERKLFESYQKQKCDPVLGTMEPHMYLGKFTWKGCLRPVGTSIYIKEVIMSMIAVHAEVTALCPPSMASVMTKVVEAAVEEMARLYGCVGKFERAGNMQATLDLRALEETVSAFSTTSTSKNFMVCRSYLEPFKDTKDRELVDNLFHQFKNQMKLQLLCFKEESIIAV